MSDLRVPLTWCGLPLVALALLALLSTPVRAETSDLLEEGMRLGLLAFPFVGMLVLGAVSMARLFDGGPPPEPAAFHASNVLSTTAFLTLALATLGPMAFLDLRSTTVPFALLAIVLLVIAVLVFTRYLLLPVWQAVAWGVVLAVGAMVSWSFLLPLTEPQVEDAVEFLGFTFVVWTLILLGLVALETLRHRPSPSGPADEPAGSGGHLTIRERMLRMAEMLVACPALGLIAVLVWT